MGKSRPRAKENPTQTIHHSEKTFQCVQIAKASAKKGPVLATRQKVERSGDNSKSRECHARPEDAPRRTEGEGGAVNPKKTSKEEAQSVEKKKARATQNTKEKGEALRSKTEGRKERLGKTSNGAGRGGINRRKKPLDKGR